MIPLHELRVGNFVMNHLSQKHFKIEKGSDIDQYASSALPVPITPELLAQYGFRFDTYFKLWQKNKAVAGTGPDMELDPDYWVLDFGHRRIGVEIKSLHQLQNLYFLLKGREIEVPTS